MTFLVVHLSHPENCMEREWDTFFQNEHWSISHLLCYFSKNATGELKLRSTAFQVERQVQGNTSDTSLRACMPTHKRFSFSFSYTPLLLLKISQISRICFCTVSLVLKFALHTQISSSSNFTILRILSCHCFFQQFLLSDQLATV